MLKFLIVVGIILLLVAYWWYRRYRARKKNRRKLSGEWGKPKERTHNWGQIRYYFDRFKSSGQRFFVDDDTWADLNFNEVFSLIDRTESNLGQQVLYDLLRHPCQNVDKLQKRDQWIQLFAEQPQLRLDLQIELQKLTGFSVWRLSNLLFEDLPKVPRWTYVLLGVPVLMVLLIMLGIVLNPLFFILAGGLFIINIGIKYFTSRYIARYTSGLSALAPFLSVSEKVGIIDLKHDQRLNKMGKKFRQATAKVKGLKNKVGNVLQKTDPTSLASIFIEYINILFLAKINMFVLSVRAIEKHQQALQQLYHHVGYLDALISTASFKENAPQLCTPTFGPAANGLHYKDMIHPLLDAPVPNSVEIGKKGILVTGSNMSGKSTFLKTLGVNQVLAQTFYFCCAEKADLTFCNVISSMRREDKITEGKSFYLAEVERVKTLITHADRYEGHHLFLLDEIFRGTNTIERVAASLKVLQWLNRPENFVLASTHDLELVELLHDEYVFRHFTEEVKEQTLTFDYKLKSGPSSTRNAIKLLEINGYPQEIVGGAMDIAEKLEHEGVINFQRKKAVKKEWKT